MHRLDILTGSVGVIGLVFLGLTGIDLYMGTPGRPLVAAIVAGIVMAPVILAVVILKEGERR